MTVNAINGALTSTLSAADGVTLSTLNAINGQTLTPTTAVVGQPLLYAGNGASKSISGADFSPDLVFIRLRAGGAGTQWRWDDNVRGAGLDIFSSTNGAETAVATGLTSFDANGFSVGNSSGWNSNALNYIAFLLQRVSGGFDVVTYTGTGSAQNVSHGLGVTPELIIVKNRSLGSRNWKVYSATLGNTKALTLDSTAAADTNSAYWNNTSPTSSVFTVNTSTLTNENTRSFVAYLFATLNPGVKVGSYTGDGNANGAFQTTNFRPRFVIIKRTDSTGAWVIFDDQTDSSSPHNTFNQLDAGTTTAETVTTNTAGGLDMTATGWQSIDSAPADININGATYIYLAIG